MTNPAVTGFPSNSANGNVAFAPLAGSSSNATDVDNPTAAFSITGEVVGNTFEISNLLFPECIPWLYWEISITFPSWSASIGVFTVPSTNLLPVKATNWVPLWWRSAALFENVCPWTFVRYKVSVAEIESIDNTAPDPDCCPAPRDDVTIPTISPTE